MIQPNRQSHRLEGYDYARNGAYFITVVCQDRKNRFGEIVNGEMVLNDAGKMIQSVWDNIPQFYDGIAIDESIIMPNHVHGIIVIHHDPVPVGAIPPWSPEMNAVDDIERKSIEMERKSIDDIERKSIDDIECKSIDVINGLPDSGRGTAPTICRYRMLFIGLNHLPHTDIQMA